MSPPLTLLLFLGGSFGRCLSWRFGSLDRLGSHILESLAGCKLAIRL